MKSFKYALNGLTYTIKYERNMRIHLCFTFYVICAGLVTGLSGGEWAVILICIGLVMALECLNTALERLCDTLCPGKNDGIKIVKDVSAAAVLCTAIASAAAGIIIFFTKEKLALVKDFATDRPILAILIALTLIPAIYLVTRPAKKRGP